MGYTFKDDPVSASRFDDFRLSMNMGFAATSPLAQAKVMPITWTRDYKLVTRRVKRKKHGRANGPKVWKTTQQWR